MNEDNGRSLIGRYWPVIVVVALAAAALGFGALRGGDKEDAAGSEPAAPSAAEGSPPPALAAFGGVDPLSAPDCDRTTGRLMIPMVYAPNCVPLWETDRDNGGATYQGVTADEIKIAIYDAEGDAEVTAAIEDAIGRPLTPAEENDLNREKVFSALNDLWETYGRTVTYVMLPASGPANDDAAAKADAIRAATELKVFAVIGGPTGTKAFAEELAARKVVCMCAESYPAGTYEKWAPFVYGAAISTTWRYTFLGELIKKLAGKPAEFAGDELTATERQFALVHYETADGAYKVAADAFIADMAEANIDVANMPYILDLATAQETAGTIVAKMKDDGVTSVIFAGDPFMPSFLAIEATSQDWYPEWIISGSALTDTAAAARRYDQSQWKHAFGLSTLLARIDPAFTEAEGNFVSWHLGETLSSYPEIITAPSLFTGIQLAGPDLTPETFRDGLFSFAPTKGFTTNWGVSWGTGLWESPDYTAADDVTLVWWDPTAKGPHEEQAAGESGDGMYRYVDGGRRYGRGELDGAHPTFFADAGTVLLYDERPASDSTPIYKPRKGRSG